MSIRELCERFVRVSGVRAGMQACSAIAAASNGCEDRAFFHSYLSTRVLRKRWSIIKRFGRDTALSGQRGSLSLFRVQLFPQVCGSAARAGLPEEVQVVSRSPA